MTLRCETCRFWERGDPMGGVMENRDGECHRYPNAIPKREYAWCGEHSAANAITLQFDTKTTEDCRPLASSTGRFRGATEVHGAKPSKIGD